MLKVNWKDYYELWMGVAQTYMYNAFSIPMREEVVCHATSQMLMGALRYISDKVGYIDENATETVSMINHVGTWVESEHLNELARYSTKVDSWRDHCIDDIIGNLETEVKHAKNVYDHTMLLMNEVEYGNYRKSNNVGNLLKQAEGK